MISAWRAGAICAISFGRAIGQLDNIGHGNVPAMGTAGRLQAHSFRLGGVLRPADELEARPLAPIPRLHLHAAAHAIEAVAVADRNFVLCPLVRRATAARDRRRHGRLALTLHSFRHTRYAFRVPTSTLSLIVPCTMLAQCRTPRPAALMRSATPGYGMATRPTGGTGLGGLLACRCGRSGGRSGCLIAPLDSRSVRPPAAKC